MLLKKFRMGWREYCSGTVGGSNKPKKDLFVGSFFFFLNPVFYSSVFNSQLKFCAVF